MKLWGGRFSGGKRDPFFEAYSESFSVDQRLVLYDLKINQAYVRELGRARILTAREVRSLTRGLEGIRKHVQSHPRWARAQSAEDVHSWVEAQLEKRAGAVAKKLRTGRSRNDLVATDTRLYAKGAIEELQRACVEILDALVSLAQKSSKDCLPGFTHLQPAQPVLLAHYLLAYFEMILRDHERLDDCRRRADVLPMGCGALAGASFPIDRKRLARELGFSDVARNSLDVTSDRDFVCELVFCCSLAMVHLSRLAEDLVIYSSPAFGFVELGDAYSTGSSLMPQKKNPDTLELIRGRAASVQGRLAGALALLKGLPLAYNRDLQEDKAALFEAVDGTRDSLVLAARVLRTLKVKPQRMKAATLQGFLTATDLADELVRRGTPFAQAHEQVGRLVKACDEAGVTFAEVSDGEARRAISTWDAKLRRVATSPLISIERKKALGGTAPGQVSRQLRAAKVAVQHLKKRLKPRR